MGLSPLHVDRVLELIRTVNQQGVTIFMVEQNAHLALQIADYGYVLQTGRIVLSGPARDLLHDPRIRDAYLGGAGKPGQPMRATDVTLHAAPPQDAAPRSLAELEARLARDLELLLVPPAKQWLEPRRASRNGAGARCRHHRRRHGRIVGSVRLEAARRPQHARSSTARPKASRGPGPRTRACRRCARRRNWSGPRSALPTSRSAPGSRPSSAAMPGRRCTGFRALQWMDYLRWYRRMIDVPIENDVEITRHRGRRRGGLPRPAVGRRRATARRAPRGAGDGARRARRRRSCRSCFAALDRRYWAHSSDDIDFAALRGKTVGVIGAGASAVDNAAEALEAGAARVAMLVRRPDVPRVNRGMGIGSPGMWHGFDRLTPAQRWSIVQHIADHAIPPPRDSMLRCSRHQNFSIIARCSPQAVAIEDRRVLLDTSRGRLAFDYLILCTGFTVDWHRRPGACLACAARPSSGATASSPTIATATTRPTTPSSGERSGVSGAGARRRALGRARALLHVSGLHEPWSHHRRHAGDQRRRRAHRARALPARCSPRTTSATGPALLAWDTPELRGDEYVIDEDVGQVRGQAGHQRSIDDEQRRHRCHGSAGRTCSGLPAGPAAAPAARCGAASAGRATRRSLRPRDDGGLTRCGASRRGAAHCRAAARCEAAEAITGPARAAGCQRQAWRRARPSGAAGVADRRWQAILAHVDRVTADPDSARREHIDGLLAAGLSPQAVRGPVAAHRLRELPVPRARGPAHAERRRDEQAHARLHPRRARVEAVDHARRSRRGHAGAASGAEDHAVQSRRRRLLPGSGARPRHAHRALSPLQRASCSGRAVCRAPTGSSARWQRRGSMAAPTAHPCTPSGSSS